jgi:hypothetical protein
MKSILFISILFFSASMLKAQDMIIFKNGETINAKVAEVGINEIKYYKSNNLQGPVYVVSKTDVTQITYSNGTKDVFPVVSNPQLSVSPPPSNTVVVTQPQTVVVERRVRRSWPYIPVFLPHIDIGHHIDLGHHGGHHGHH